MWAEPKLTVLSTEDEAKIIDITSPFPENLIHADWSYSVFWGEKGSNQIAIEEQWTRIEEAVKAVFDIDPDFDKRNPSFEFWVD